MPHKLAPPIITTAADFYETRQNTLHMRWPHDADTTRRLDWVLKGNERVPWLRRLLRRVARVCNYRP